MKLSVLTSVTRSRTVGRTPWTGDQLVARPLSIHKHKNAHTTQTLNIHAQSGVRTHGPGVRTSEIVHALDRSSIVIGISVYIIYSKYIKGLEEHVNLQFQIDNAVDILM
jgi:hypothetical protein